MTSVNLSIALRGNHIKIIHFQNFDYLDDN